MLFLINLAHTVKVRMAPNSGEYVDCVALVPKVGVEPTRPCGQRFLRPSRLPFRHFGQWARLSG